MHETVVELLTQQYEVSRIQEAKDTPTGKVLRRRNHGGAEISQALAGCFLSEES